MITKEILKCYKPCKTGYIQVLEKYGNKFSVSYEELLADFPLHKDWIVKYLYQYRNKLDPSYKGNFKIGQFVYREGYGMGNYFISRIGSIEKSADKTHFVFMVTARNESWRGETFNCVSEEDLFTTLDELKYCWHKKIDRIT